jgi:hypothetical protein
MKGCPCARHEGIRMGGMVGKVLPLRARQACLVSGPNLTHSKPYVSHEGSGGFATDQCATRLSRDNG